MAVMTQVESQSDEHRSCDDPSGVTGAGSVQLGGVVCDIDTLPVGLQFEQAPAGAGSWSRPQQGQSKAAAVGGSQSTEPPSRL